MTVSMVTVNVGLGKETWRTAYWFKIVDNDFLVAILLVEYTKVISLVLFFVSLFNNN